MPAFNSTPWIGDAIESIRAQDYDAFEIIVIDDGSTDGTAEAVRRLDDRIRVFEQDRQGPAAARNLGVARAKGEYLAFLDADDLWLPGKLRLQMEFFTTHPDARIVYTQHAYFSADDQVQAQSATAATATSATPSLDHELSGWIYPELLLDSHIHIITAVIHRSVFDTVGGFDGQFGKGSDYDFWIRAARHFPAFRLKRVTALYRIHEKGITARHDSICAGYEILTRAIEQYGYSGPDGRRGNVRLVRKHIAQVCFDHGYAHFWRGSPVIAFRDFVRAVRYGDWRPKTLGYSLMSMCRILLKPRYAASNVVV